MKSPATVSNTCFLTAAVVTIGLTTATAAQHPTSPPPPGPMRELQLPPFEEASLANGLRIVIVENHELPVVTVWLTFPAGAAFEGHGKEGLTSFASDLLLRGTTNRTAEEIAEQIEGVGSSLDVGAGADFFNVSTTVLTEHVDLAFDLMSDVIGNSTFPQDEVELSRTRLLSSLQAQEAQPGFLADKFFSEALYGDHPYGRTATTTSVRAITRNDIVQFASNHLKPRGAILVLAGDISPTDGIQMAEQYFGGWSGTAPARSDVDMPPSRPTEIILVNRPGSEQSNIVVGNLTMEPGDPDYYASVLANHVLGGGSDARLFLILREEKGWTYGAYSSHDRAVDIGQFQATAEVRTPVTDSALVELLTQIRRMRTEQVTDAELDAAKGFVVGSFPRQIETPQQIASQVRTTRLFNLDDDYLRTYRSRLASVTPDQVIDVSGRLMRPDSAVIVVVGDGPAIYEKLLAIAPTRIIDAAGNPLSPADLHPEVTALEFDRDNIVAGSDSFAVLVQGNEFGYLTRNFVMGDQDGRSVMTVTSALSLGPIGSQTSTLVVDLETMQPVSFDQTGQLQGMPAEVHLSYNAGRVTGDVNVPQEAGARRQATIDTVLGDHVIDDSMLQAFVGSLPLAEGSSVTAAAYDGSDGKVSLVTLTPREGGTITVPAGSFETFEVDLTGAAAPLKYWIRKDGTRDLVKMAIVGQPLEFVLVRGR